MLVPKTPAAVSSCCRDSLVVGDRNGSVHLFEWQAGNEAPVQSLIRLHGRNGVSDVRSFAPGTVTTTGRDGVVNIFHLVSTTHLPSTSLCGAIHSHFLIQSQKVDLLGGKKET